MSQQFLSALLITLTLHTLDSQKEKDSSGKSTKPPKIKDKSEIDSNPLSTLSGSFEHWLNVTQFNDQSDQYYTQIPTEEPTE